ncbi:MAG: sigma 54-interacting transcriptional regulator [Saprospiraceae bacterium]|nr:sigma 54-interacting transcriptional regulator [Saprospiraceae bacterium]
MIEIKTLGELKASGYQSKSIKDEFRENLISKLQNSSSRFEGILGFENSVLPDMERAILSRHSILLLGLRGQAKTKIARQMITLLDEYIPVIEGSEINDDPLQPISAYGKKRVTELQEETPITWLHRSQRYVEKLATPDVSVSDLIGDIDPVKAATQKLSFSNEEVIHFGLIPRAHRCIFVINELPDLQARIQVSLFNMLQEGDIQIRGFKMRLPLDVSFVFTANPEDYTNRGSIITPLKDRIESQILTHYPSDLAIAKAITLQEAHLTIEQRDKITIAPVHHEILERMVMKARQSEFVDGKSGVSARVAISGYENLVSAVERRMLINGESRGVSRIADFQGVLPSLTGKIELVYEGEQEGPVNVAWKLMNEAIKDVFLEIFPNPDTRKRDKDVYGVIKAYFSGGNHIQLVNDVSNDLFQKNLNAVAGLQKLVASQIDNTEETQVYMELMLHGLAEMQVIGKSQGANQIDFSDPLSRLLNFDDED